MRTGVVVFLGTLARHLPPTDPKRRGITEVLVGVLATPSEAVQVRTAFVYCLVCRCVYCWRTTCVLLGGRPLVSCAALRAWMCGAAELV